MTAPEEPATGPVIRDNRRIDPVTGQPRRGKHAVSKPAGTAGAGRPGGPGPAQPGGAGDDGTVLEDEVTVPESGAAPTAATVADESAADGKLQVQLAERTADLQRLQAEYANYRKRVDRDRVTVREQATSAVLSELLPVLDAIGQARDHGELSGGFKSVADSLQAAVGKLGLVSYGQPGDAFDPKIHEALAYTYADDVTEDTCVEIFQPGYKVGERIMRPARVAVAAPATGPDGSGNAPGEPAGDEDNS